MDDSLIDELYPDHDRSSCSDADPCNADPAGSHGCARCTAIAMSSMNGLKVRIAELEAEVARLRKDAERLDWLERNGSCRFSGPNKDIRGEFFTWVEQRGGEFVYSSTLRDAIDSSVSGDSK